MPKITIRAKRHKSDHCGNVRTIHCTKALPFGMSPRATLVHRVRYLCINRDINGEYSHHSATFWCGSTQHEAMFFDDPPKERLLCAVCERNATKKRLPTAAELAGRHVCTGTMKVHRLCCRNEQN